MAVSDEYPEGQTRLISVKRWPEIHEWPSEAGLRHLIFYADSNGFESLLFFRAKFCNCILHFAVAELRPWAALICTAWRVAISFTSRLANSR